MSMKFKDVEDSLVNSRWDILSAVAQGAKRASEISKATGTSLANISQQAKLLEAKGLLKFEKQKGKEFGKPQRIHTIKKEVAFIALLQNGRAEKRTVEVDLLQEKILNILLFPKLEEHYFLFKFLWQQEEYIQKCKALAVVESEEKETHLLALAPQETLEELRKKYSKVEIRDASGKKAKIFISWTHSKDEIEEGLNKEEPYFINLLKKPYIIFDPGGGIRELLQKRGED